MARLHAGRKRGGVTAGAAASRLHGGIRDIILYTLSLFLIEELSPLSNHESISVLGHIQCSQISATADLRPMQAHQMIRLQALALFWL